MSNINEYIAPEVGCIELIHESSIMIQSNQTGESYGSQDGYDGNWM